MSLTAICASLVIGGFAWVNSTVHRNLYRITLP